MNLISVLVASYNSGKYIVDLLDSIANQTFERIELIIADDGSKDATIEIVNEWLKEHAARFERVEIITVEKNTGTTANMNRGLRACTGKYIKVIAADDILLPRCLEVCEAACEKNGYPLVLGNVDWVKADGKTIIERPAKQNDTSFFEKTATEQYHILLKENFLPAPAAFYNREFMLEQGGFDEQFGLIEDYPFWLKILARGVKIEHLDESVVLYRQNDDSVANQKADHRIFNPLIIKNSSDIFFELRYRQLKEIRETAFAERMARIVRLRNRIVASGNDDRRILCKIYLKLLNRLV